MKFELVDFYKNSNVKKTQKKNTMVGTVHVYLVDDEMDLRGIRVTTKGDKIFFHLPRGASVDEEGKLTWYPIFTWTNAKKHDDLIDFLHQVAKPAIKLILDGQG